MTHPEFPAQVSRRVEAAGFDPGDVVFELVEQQTDPQSRAFSSAVRQVRRFGFRVALDDFGVGFCNLHLLLDLRPDYVKLPRYFTTGSARTPTGQEVVRTVRTLVAMLGTPVIMEGIEIRRGARGGPPPGRRVRAGKLTTSRGSSPPGS